MPQMLTIDDFNYSQHIDYVGPDGKPRAKGMIPATRRPNYRSAYVENFTLPLLNEADIPAMIADQEANQNSLQHIRLVGNNGAMIPSRDQDSWGYCWIHSGGSAMILARAAAHQPYVDLSPFSSGCLIKGYRDEGGNGDEGLDFIAKTGMASSATWPQQSSKRSNDTPAMRADMALHRALKWMALDVGSAQYKLQMATCLLTNRPLVTDFDWWSHSVCGARLVSYNPFVLRIWNSWGDGWSDQGFGDLTGSKAIPDGCWVLISETASEK